MVGEETGEESRLGFGGEVLADKLNIIHSYFSLEEKDSR